MRYHHLPVSMLFFISCGNASIAPFVESGHASGTLQGTAFQVHPSENSWAYFLQHLPIKEGPVMDYRGRNITYQDKSAGIIPFDVGHTDLQQCADALMRLRAEYLFGQGRHEEIGFHFVSGYFYTWKDFCRGKRPVARGNGIQVINTTPSEKTHKALRKYLDIVYTYASTISLAKELKNANGFEVGTVVIYAGSPGHCFIIIDEATDPEGNKLFKLAEGYTPAQSIYVLRNLSMEENSPWHKLTKGTIETASYTFTNYELKRFE